MALPPLPPSVDIDTNTRKAVIEGLKAALTTFEKAGLMDAGLTYQHLISSPDVLSLFIDVFQNNRELCDTIVKAPGGKPVRDDDQPLVCAISLNQVQQLLVRTCAKKFLEAEKQMETVTETVTKKSLFGLFKTSEQVEVTREAHDPVAERKARELSHHMAFAWQLPLLAAFRKHMSYQQAIALGEDVLALQTPEAIIAVSKFDGETLRKVKQAAGPDFVEILLTRPQAIAGVAIWNREMYQLYRKVLGESAWHFFARDKRFFNVAASLDKTGVRILGTVLCFIATENLEELQRLNLDKLEILISGMRTGYGAKLLPLVLSQPSFAKDMLRPIVETLLHTNQEKDKLMVAYEITCKAMIPNVQEWLSKLPPTE